MKYSLPNFLLSEEPKINDSCSFFPAYKAVTNLIMSEVIKCLLLPIVVFFKTNNKKLPFINLVFELLTFYFYWMCVCSLFYPIIVSGCFFYQKKCLTIGTFC